MTAALLFFMALHPTVQLLLLVVFLLLIGWLLYHLFDDGAVQIHYTPKPHEPQSLADILGPPVADPLDVERRRQLNSVVDMHRWRTK